MKKIITILILFCLFLAPSYLYPRTIFFIASYDKYDLCGAPQLKGALQAIKNYNFNNLTLKKYYINCRYLPFPEIQKKITLIEKQINQMHPMIIITFDDFAFKTFAKKYIGNKDIKIVFSGVNGDLNKYNQQFHFFDNSTELPIKNITGVHERLFLKDQFDFIRMIFKKVPNVAVPYSTDSIGKILYHQIKTELKDTVYLKHLSCYPVSSLNDFYKIVDTISSNKNIDAYLPIVLSIKDKKNNIYLTAKELIPIMIRKIRKIDIAINKTFAKAGLFGGVSVDFYSMGFLAGRKAAFILKGIDIKKLKIEEAHASQIIINKKRFKDLKLNLDDKILNIVDEFYN